MRQVERIFKMNDAHWVGNGFRVKQYFPKGQGREFLERFSPFILLDYNEPHFFKGTSVETGIGPHPHRGFETVTFAFEGKVAHGDNKGNSGIIEPGDIQWMTAGSGILHKEYHEKEYAKEDRTFHMIQLWVDLPKEHKMTEPGYQAIVSDQMGIYKTDNESAIVTVYAGEFKGVKGPASTFSPMNIYKITLKEGKTLVFKEPSEFNLGMLVLSGHVKINEIDEAFTSDFILFENSDSEIKIEGFDETSEIFVLSGKPLNQPVVAYGPFVMTTKEEIIQANNDYERGAFGSSNF